MTEIVDDETTLFTVSQVSQELQAWITVYLQEEVQGGGGPDIIEHPYAFNKSVHVYQPDVEVDISLDNSTGSYSQGESIMLTTTLTGSGSDTFDAHARIWISDSAGIKVFGPVDFDVTIGPGSPWTGDIHVNTGDFCDSMDDTGMYIIHALVFGSSIFQPVGGSTQSFSIVPQSWLVTHEMPSGGYGAGTGNTVRFIVRRTGTGSNDDLAFHLTIRDPDNNLILSNEQQVIGTMGLDDMQLITYDVDFGTLLQGNYIFECQVINHPSGGPAAVLWTGQFTAPNDPFITTLLDKVSYSVRDELTLTIPASNYGCFNDIFDLEITGLSQTPTPVEIFLPVNQTTPIPVSITSTLPDDMDSGLHQIHLQCLQNTSKQLQSDIYFNIPDSRLKLELPVASVTSGDELMLHVHNTGGVDSYYEYECSVTDPYGIDILNTSGATSTIQAGTGIGHFLDIPAQAVSGRYTLAMTGRDKTSGQAVSMIRPFQVQGLDANFDIVITDPFFAPDEHVDAELIVNNYGPNIEDATLRLWLEEASRGPVNIHYVGSGDLSHGSGGNLIPESPNGVTTRDAAGYWREILNSGVEQFAWDTVTWTGQTPGNSAIGMRFRTADRSQDLPGAPWYPSSGMSDDFSLSGLDQRWSMNAGDYAGNDVLVPGDGFLSITSDADTFIEYPSDPEHDDFPFITQSIPDNDDFIVAVQLHDFNISCQGSDGYPAAGIILRGGSGFTYDPPVLLLARSRWHQCGSDLQSVSLWIANADNMAEWRLHGQVTTDCSDPVLRLERRGDNLYAAFSEDNGDTFTFMEEPIPSNMFTQVKAGLFALASFGTHEASTATPTIMPSATPTAVPPSASPTFTPSYTPAVPSPTPLITPGATGTQVAGTPVATATPDFSPTPGKKMRTGNDFTIRFGPVDFQKFAESPDELTLSPQGRYLELQCILRDEPDEYPLTDHFLDGELRDTWTSVNTDGTSPLGRIDLLEEPGTMTIEAFPDSQWNLDANNVVQCPMILRNLPPGDFKVCTELFDYHPFAHDNGAGIAITDWSGYWLLFLRSCESGMNEFKIIQYHAGQTMEIFSQLIHPVQGAGDSHFTLTRTGNTIACSISAGGDDACYAISAPSISLPQGIEPIIIGLICGSDPDSHETARFRHFQYEVPGFPVNNHMPVLESVSACGDLHSDIQWETTIAPLSIFGTWNSSITIPGQGVEGKFRVFGELTGTTHQCIAKDNYPFYWTSGSINLSVDLKTDPYEGCVPIIGEVGNKTNQQLDDLLLRVSVEGVSIYEKTVSLAPTEYLAYSCWYVPPEPGRYDLRVDLVSGARTDVFIEDTFEVTEPRVITSVVCPAEVSVDPFDTVIHLQNATGLPLYVVVNTYLQGQTSQHQLSLEPWGITVITENHQIDDNAVYRVGVELSGTYVYVFSRQIEYNENPQMQLQTKSGTQFAPGAISIPYSFSNSGGGVLSGHLEFILTGPGVQNTISRAVELPAGGIVPGHVDYYLESGSYSLEWRFNDESELLQFQVMPRFAVDLTADLVEDGNQRRLVVQAQNSGTQPVLGELTVTDSDLLNRRAVTIAPGELYTGTMDIPPGLLCPGHHTLTVTLRGQDSDLTVQTEVECNVSGADIQIASLPHEVTAGSGERISFPFGLINSGDSGESVRLSVSSGEILHQNRKIYLAAGCSDTLVFQSDIPSDLPAGEYYLEYSLSTGESGVIPFTVTGLEFDVKLLFDKRQYAAGEAGTCEYVLTFPAAQLMSRITRLRLTMLYGDELKEKWIEVAPGTVKESFAFQANADLTKLFWGVYAETGRSLRLGDRYVRIHATDFTVLPDRDCYNLGDKIHLTLYSDPESELSLNGPGIHGAFKAHPEGVVHTFTLPEKMVGGTYRIHCKSGNIHAEIPFDVSGESVRVVDIQPSGNKSAPVNPGETVNLEFTLIATKTENISIEVMLEPPYGDKSRVSSKSVKMVPGKVSRVDVPVPVRSVHAGTNELFYTILSNNVPVVEGRATVDIGPGKVVSVNVYPHHVESEKESVTTLIEVLGWGEGEFEIRLDSDSILRKTVVLDGFEVLDFPVPVKGMEPGLHAVQAVLTFSDCLSEKSDWFELFDVVDDGDSGKTGMPNVRTRIIPEIFTTGGLRDGPGIRSGPDIPPSPPGSPSPSPPYIPASTPMGIVILIAVLTMVIAVCRRVRS